MIPYLHPMKFVAVAAANMLGIAGMTQIYVPPDIFGDSDQGVCVLRKNGGQVLDSNGDQPMGIKFYFENTPIGIWLKKESSISLSVLSTHADTLTPDSAFRVDVKFSKSRDVQPAEIFGAPGRTNYYRGAIAVEDVKAYYRAVYKSVEDSVDVHFYGSSGGPRIAFVVRPGGDPSDISLEFNGQDSLGIDWEGDLKLWLDEHKWVEFQQAIAYQVDGNGDPVLLPWLPEWTHEDTTVHAGLSFENYDPELPLVFEVGYLPMMGGGEPDHRNLTWSTFADAEESDQLESVEVDEVGDPYLCGYTYQQFYPFTVGTTVIPIGVPQPTSYCAVAMRFDHETKQIIWGTYIGGAEPGIVPKTEANKLAVYTGPSLDHQYVFVTGSTTCTDFEPWTSEETVFEIAEEEEYEGGKARMWVGAFLKENGFRDWATTHGQIGDDTWGEHGRAIDVDSQGRLVVGGKLEAFATAVVPDFPRVTPIGAFTRAAGDGFFIWYDEDYQIEWSSAFCEFSEHPAHGGVYDLQLTKKNTEPSRGVWLVGATADMVDQDFDLVAPPGAYFRETAGYLSPFIAFLNLDTYVLEYSTRWGDVDAGLEAMGSAYGIHETPGRMWVVGFTNAVELTLPEVPLPEGPGGAHWANESSSELNQTSEGFIIRFDISDDNYVLDYGTLIGGIRDDILLDVTSDGDGKIYITGETRSNAGFHEDLDPFLYYQPQYNYWNRRDALVIGLEDETYPTMFWRTAFGGKQSDRGWGIAASESEVYICGATANQDDADEFPLHEFNTDPDDPNSELDWYWDWNFQLSTEETIDTWHAFYRAMDYEWAFNELQIIEGIGLPHDGFIASFYMDEATIGLPPIILSVAGQLLAHPLGDDTWLVQAPTAADWTLALHDATGRLVRTARWNGKDLVLNLSMFTSGLYSLRINSTDGQFYTAKLLKP